MDQSRKFQVACDPIDVTRRLFELISHQPGITMHLCWRAFTVAIVFFATQSVAEPFHGRRLLAHVENLATFARPLILVSNENEPDVDMFALMSGKCSTLKIAGRNFACKAVAFFHNQQGRANFTVVLDDPTDDSHVISFSGENSRREQENLYELSIDRMLLKSKDRPKAYGMPVPLVELSTGTCKQLGSFATGQVSSIACIAMAANGKKYELQFESDGSPMRVMKLRESPAPTEERRARQNERLECRLKADGAKVLPRDRTAYIIRCLAEDSQEPTADGQQ